MAPVATVAAHNVGSGGRHTHPQNYAGQHREQHGKEQAAAGGLDDHVSQLQTDTGKVYNTHNHAADGGGDCHAHPLLGAVLQCLDQTLQVHTGVFLQGADYDQSHDAQEAGVGGTVVHHQQRDQNRHREQHMAAELQFLSDLGQLVLRIALQTGALRLQINVDPQSHIVQNSGDDGIDDDGSVRHP